MRYRDEKVVGVFRVAHVERVDSFSSRVAFYLEDDLISDPVFALKEIAKEFRIGPFGKQGEYHFRNMGIATAHFSPVCGEPLRSEKIKPEIVCEENADIESRRQVRFEKREVLFFDAVDSRNEYFRSVFEPFELFRFRIPIVSPRFRNVNVLRRYASKLFGIAEPFRENVYRIH